MGSCAAPSAKGDDKFITTDYLQQCLESAYLGYFFHHFWRYFRFLLRSLPLTYHLVHPKQVGQGE
ncbi:hypothetical protein CWN47_38385 [Klebsiella variicola]|uniref:Uncharacterized protein n=1 Tax=Klebsiella variicola TaxID=244366 RepID=A0A2N4YN66_KLEVA|nr:hypothetical protein CWN47_38385 [Klebsiella variicola]